MSLDGDLTMGQAMKAFNVSRKTLRKWCRDGTVDAYQIPTKRKDWRIKRESVSHIRDQVEKFALEQMEKLGL